VSDNVVSGQMSRPQPGAPGRKRPTMRNVAAAAGVSFKTVSRVVNQESGVSAALVERVNEAVAELGYQPDDRARNLRSGDTSTKSIGFVQVDAANPFFSAIFRGLEDVARAHDCLVLSGSSDRDPEREEALISNFVARRVDGLVIASNADTFPVVEAEMARGTPVVFVDRTPRGLRADVVRSDHRGGARQAIEHLLAQGHRDIAYLGRDAAIFTSELRRLGFEDAMNAAGVPVRNDLVIEGLLGQDEAELVASRLLTMQSPPTAIFSAQNFITMGVVRALHLSGRQHDVAQVGFDDIDFADLLEPGISVVPQRPREIGRLAGERLFARLGGADLNVEEQLISSEILRRGSGEITPQGDPS